VRARRSGESASRRKDKAVHSWTPAVAPVVLSQRRTSPSRAFASPVGVAPTAGLPRLIAASAAVALMLAALEPAAAAGGALGAGGVTVTSPVSEAVVAGTVEVAATAAEATISVSFEWSEAGSDQWAVIDVDEASEDGWQTEWDTRGYSGRARLRAIATMEDGERTGSVEESAAVEVGVDNEPPGITLGTSRLAFSPNRDGRMDKLGGTVRTTEDTRVDVTLENRRGQILRTWQLGSIAQQHSFDWGGRAGGSMVSDGRYVITAVATDGVDLRAQASRKVIVDTKRPRLKLRRVSPATLHKGTRVTALYALRDRSRRSSLRLRVRGNIVSRTIDTGRHSSGRGRVRRRLRLPTGAYRIRMVAKDDAGNVGRSRARPWRVLRAARARVYRRLERTGPKVALTFDDCYDTAAWSDILKSLRRHRARGTFFCNGVHVAAHPRLARRTVKWGNAIGSHTPDHALLTSLPASGTERRLRQDISIWWRVARRTPAPYFRPPYGAYNRATLSGAGASAHSRVVLWDVDTQDWKRPGAGVIAARARSARAGSIVLMHATGQTAAAMPAILRDLDNRSLRPVTLPGLFHAARDSGALRMSVDPGRSWRGLYAAQRAAELISRSSYGHNTLGVAREHQGEDH
jgi:peptidoglycan-N-acetylglucosamine deacetylase